MEKKKQSGRSWKGKINEINVCNRNMVVEPTCNSGTCEADAGG